MNQSSAWQLDLARYPERPWLREQSIWAIAIYRFGRWNDARSNSLSQRLFDRIYWLIHRIIETVTGISITKGADIGGGLRIYHFGGIMIHSNARIGNGCTLRQGCTIGNRTTDGPVPIIGNDVEFGAYAQVLGGIQVGDGAKIGAMSVVMKDVPPGATAVGIPARIITPKEEASDHD